MSISKRRRLAPRLRAALAAAALAALLSFSCVESAPAGPIVQLIPQDALAAVVVESPYKLYAAAEEFWKASGFDKAAGGDLQGLLEKSLPPSSGALDALDFGRPWAVAILPAQTPAEASGSAEGAVGVKKTRTFVYIPYRSSPEELLKKLLGDSSLVSVAKAKGYIVLSDEGGQIRFPPAKGADLSRLKRFPASSVKLWADPIALRRATQDGFKPIADAARRFATDPAGRRETDPAAMAAALADFGASFLSQLELADASFEPGAAGIVLRAGVSSAGGSELRETLASAASGPSALDWASLVASGSLFGASWSIDGQACRDLSRQLMEGLFAALGLPAEAAASASALQAEWAKAEGPRGAMNLDLDIDAEALADLRGREPGSGDPADYSALLAKAFRLKFDLIREARDQAAYRTLLRGMGSDPDFLALSKAYAEAFGLSFSTTSRELKQGAFSYGELGFSLGVADEAKLSSLGSGVGAFGSSPAAASTALRAFGAQLATRWTISQGRFAATNGDLAALKALSARKSAAKSLASEPAFAKTMPPKPVFVGTLSLRKLMALSESSAAAASSSAADSEAPDADDSAGHAAPPTPPALDPSSFGSWYTYLAVDARWGSPGLEAGIFIPASDLGAFVRSGAAPVKLNNKPQNGGV